MTPSTTPQHFAIVGAMKAATTSLAELVGAHPQISSHPVKELNYFSVDAGSDPVAYEHLFRQMSTPIVGEASPSYSEYHRYPGSIERLHTVIPDARLVYSLRDPLERMLSHYRHEILQGRESRPADVALDDPFYLWPSLYSRAIEHMLTVFPGTQIAIVDSETIFGDPRAISDLYAFLGADPLDVPRDARTPSAYAAGDRAAIGPVLGAVRRSPLGRLSRLMPDSAKQKVRRALARSSRGKSAQERLISAADRWQPSNQVLERLADDIERLPGLLAACTMIGDDPSSRWTDTHPISAPDSLGGSTTARPTISIAVPVFNPSHEHLARMAKSVNKQTVTPDEVVICDQSATSHEELVAGLFRDDIKVHYHHVLPPDGMVGNWNRVVERSTGDAVVQLHQDDALAPSALEIMREYLAHGAVQVGVGEILDRPARFTNRRPNHRSFLYEDGYAYGLSHDDLVYLMLRNGQVFAEPSGVMFLRRAFDDVGGYDPAFTHSVDIDFTLRASRRGVSAYVALPLVQRTRHESQATVSNVTSGTAVRERHRLYDTYAAEVSPQRRFDDVRAGLASRAVFDLVRAARHRRWPVVRSAWADCRFYRPPPAAAGRRVLELARWTNHDRARLRPLRAVIGIDPSRSSTSATAKGWTGAADQ